ncbi:MAG: serine hydrolase domain-containing protein [Acidobacteriota bacterium]
MRRFLLITLWVALCSPMAWAAEEKKEPKPQTIPELEKELGKVLEETKLPAVGVALVSRDAVLWTAGIGKADVASGRDATADTLFRIGSISKSFVSISVLMLQEAGKLSLDDLVRVRAPDVWFENPWEDSNPLRIVHLLEHATGFDDLRLKEYALNDPHISLADGLAYCPASRVSRWRPGTRYSYCNSGPPIAARIVERISGSRFEDFVREQIFEPLGMKTASYLLTDQVKANIATLYHPDGVTPYPYWHICMRPSGAVNASPMEMANLVRFYLNRGSFEGRMLLQPSSIERMERPASTWSARAGLTTGYGLSNYTTVDSGFVYHGHDGGVQGGAASMGYLPGEGLGYCFMINGGNAPAFERIEKLIKGYLTKDLPRPAVPPIAKVPADLAQRYSGYYRFDSPRQELTRFMTHLLGVVSISVGESGLFMDPFMGESTGYVCVNDRLFREKSEKDEDPVATLALIEDPVEGRFVQTDSVTWRPVRGWIVWVERIVAIGSIALMLSSLSFAIIWLPRKLLGRMRAVRHLRIRVVPLVSVLCFAAASVLLTVAGTDLIPRFGRPTVWSVGFCALTVAFAIAAVLGLLLAARAPASEVNRWARWHSIAVSVANTIVAAYLLYWGMIGLRSWS